MPKEEPECALPGCRLGGYVRALESRVETMSGEIKELTGWKDEHHGRIEAWWTAQFKWNDRIQTQLETLVRWQTRQTAIWAVVLFLATLAVKFL